jgi:hypothetical protein
MITGYYSAPGGLFQSFYRASNGTLTRFEFPASELSSVAS